MVSSTTNPSWARELWRRQTCELWGSAALESPVYPRSAPAPVWPGRLLPPLSPSSWPSGPSATTPASRLSHSAHPSPGGKKKNMGQLSQQFGLDFDLNPVIIFYLLHSVARQFVAWPKHRPMILHCQMLQLRPHGLLLLWHHTERSGLHKNECVQAFKNICLCRLLLIIRFSSSSLGILP